MEAPIDVDAAKLKALRESREWSQARLAEYLGCSQPTVSKMENGAEIAKPYRKLLAPLLRELAA
jgi:transcriptional regulator with XRE-family HTH domain